MAAEAEQVAKTAQVRAEYKARMVKGMVRKLLNSNYCNLARVLHATLAAEPDIGEWPATVHWATAWVEVDVCCPAI